MDERGLGKQLQEARRSAGYTQQQLCEMANLSFSTLTKIERGAIKAPSIFTIQSIADALKLSLDELMGRETPGAARRALSKTKAGASFIYFDVNGCLVHYYQRAFTKIAAETGGSPDAVEMVYWQYDDSLCQGTMSMSDFNAELAKALGVKSVDWQSAYLGSIELVTEMQEVLKWASEHYKVGLLTNIMPGLLAALRREGMLPDVHYDAIIDSSEVGHIKPSAKIFEIAQEKAGVDPGEIMLIDDDKANIMAAQKLGWHVMLFDDALPQESATRARNTLEPAQEV